MYVNLLWILQAQAQVNEKKKLIRERTIDNNKFQK